MAATTTLDREAQAVREAFFARERSERAKRAVATRRAREAAGQVSAGVKAAESRRARLAAAAAEAERVTRGPTALELAVEREARLAKEAKRRADEAAAEANAVSRVARYAGLKAAVAVVREQGLTEKVPGKRARRELQVTADNFEAILAGTFSGRGKGRAA